MSILLINSAPFTTEFIDPICELFAKKKINYKTVNYNDLPESLDSFKGIIISSSPMGDDIIDEQLPLYQWIKNYSKPIIGSCHGHQLLGSLYGSEIIINKESEEGVMPIEFIKDDELFNGLSKIFMVEQHHKKSVTIPINFEHLAQSSGCKNQIMKHHSKPFYGCQFHIEKAPELLINFANLCN